MQQSLNERATVLVVFIYRYEKITQPRHICEYFCTLSKNESLRYKNKKERGGKLVPL